MLYLYALVLPPGAESSERGIDGRQSALLSVGGVEVNREIARGTFQNYFLADAEKYLTRWCELEPGVAEPRLLRMRLLKWLGRVERWRPLLLPGRMTSPEFSRRWPRRALCRLPAALSSSIG